MFCITIKIAIRNTFCREIQLASYNSMSFYIHKGNILFFYLLIEPRFHMKYVRHSTPSYTMTLFNFFIMASRVVYNVNI